MMVIAAIYAASLAAGLVEELMEVHELEAFDKWVFAVTEQWNTPAIRLYEHFGFEREGVRRGHYSRDGVDVDALLMAYHLPSGPESPPSPAP